MTKIKPVKPEIKMFGMPDWHHHHSSKLSVCDRRNLPENTLILKSSVVEISIYPRDGSASRGWIVEYQIFQSADTFVKAKIFMSKQDLKVAFRLSDNCDEQWGQSLLDKYGGDVACQGKYIRYGNYLNIPGPGTGHDGDINVSILITEEIKDAVELLIE